MSCVGKKLKLGGSAPMYLLLIPLIYLLSSVLKLLHDRSFHSWYLPGAFGLGWRYFTGDIKRLVVYGFVKNLNSLPEESDPLALMVCVIW